MPRGGARPGAGKKKLKPELPAAVKRTIATDVLNSLGKDWKHAKECVCEICQWRALILSSADSRIKIEALKYLTDKRDGKAVHTVNHLHDKPIEHTHTHTLGEGMRIAMQKAEQRLLSVRVDKKGVEIVEQSSRSNG
jgi:hypothetical protein